jgi:hypothetical protein
MKVKLLVCTLLFATTLAAAPARAQSARIGNDLTPPIQAPTRILLPLFIGDTPGAFGTMFRTDVWAIAKRREVRLYGAHEECGIVTCLRGPYWDDPAIISTEEGVYIGQNGTPGRFLYVAPADAKELSFTLLAWERSTREITTLPVVRFDEVADTQIVLPSVPLLPTHRATLRIYAVDPARVTIRAGRAFEQVEETVQLEAGRDEFEPAYATWSNLPTHISEFEVRVTADVPVWAMLTLTDNATQKMTVIWPQP